MSKCAWQVRHALNGQTPFVHIAFSRRRSAIVQIRTVLGPGLLFTSQRPWQPDVSCWQVTMGFFVHRAGAAGKTPSLAWSAGLPRFRHHAPETVLQHGSSDGDSITPRSGTTQTRCVEKSLGCQHLRFSRLL